MRDPRVMNQTRATPEPRGLTLRQGSSEAYFNAFWLRDNCRSSFDPQTHERIVDISATLDPPVVANAAVDGKLLSVVWADGHRSTYEIDELWRWHRTPGRDDPARLPRRQWLAGSEDRFLRFDAATLDTSAELQRTLAETLIVDGIAIVQGLADTGEALTDLAQLLGDVRPSVAGAYFDVCLHDDPVNLSYTESALELHTDTPAEEFPPGIQFLHCRANEVAGGRTLFVDGVAVAEGFRREDPDGFELLVTYEVPFFYDHDVFDWRSHQRVIELDHEGAVSGVTVSQHMADRFDLPQRLLDDYYPAFCKFLRLLRHNRYVNRMRFDSGDCVVFDNHRVVHGREAFEASGGRRHLRGCYIDRGELRSTYRTLVRKQRSR